MASALSRRQKVLYPYIRLCAKLVLVARRPKIVGITGSVGKTTTKEMIAAILSQEAARSYVGQVGTTWASLNNIIGLPSTLLGYRKIPAESGFSLLREYGRVPFRALRLILSRSYPDVLVLEYGAGLVTYLHRQVKFARPDIGVVTMIGPAHTERLGSIEGVVREKSALASAPPPGGAVILGGGHPDVEDLRACARAPVTIVQGKGLDLNRNIAREVARKLGVPGDIIEAGLTSFKSPPGRLNRHEIGPMTLIDDSFNANPLSMKLGLDTMAETARPEQRKIAMLGFMAELGGNSAEAHREVGAYARERADLIVGVGGPAKDYGPGEWFETTDQCIAALPELLRENDMVFVKGSKASGMKEVVTAIVKR